MAKKTATGNAKVKLNDNFRKGTSIGLGKLKMSSMSKDKKRSFKKYRGQGH